MTPKEKSAESKLITAREKTPARLTTHMLRGQALKSLEHTDSLKLQQGNEDNHKLEDWSQSNSLCVPAPTKEERKEDSLELEDDISLRCASEPLREGRENQETSATNKSSSSAEKLAPESAGALPEIRTSPELISGKRSDLEIGNAMDVGKEKTGVTIPNIIASGTTSQLVTPLSPLGSENPKQGIQEVTTFQSSSSLVTEISSPKSIPLDQAKSRNSLGQLILHVLIDLELILSFSFFCLLDGNAFHVSLQFF
ncbi:uncharacterized protein [Coffea arabica]|uniref:Uncharacterized protein LOC113716447 n=1 Tax=Coffea arabica TaxID=13443 RepID=A0A6P6V164_COFAR|nr:uncharacterized protein LOC113716447 [Coffea arabica]XP_027096578.1 uncharacterized protein LOC113716447 [Coffea arabica]XP_027096579.1 uncharacterized protein LOC113716447 [Coffea arabica]XP_027096580.1 uncharacterized protein LOC113716447 [Coffea arabica]XP_027096581.1 uncharacterized protein LOC113716447 [Coffea arabica]XP_027096582.1 uncharacterized protein LOC113716447 [Coffea arabica]XP_027096583.1 uncharacterized protein LOC113716447 [Coffea arabica]